MNIRRFNDDGLQRMGQFLDSLTTEEPMPWPEDLLTDASASVVVQPTVEIEACVFADRFEAAGYLNARFGDASLDNVEQDRGLWAWLALFYFDQLAPSQTGGSRKVGERARWIPAVGDFRKYYRHLLAGPFRVYRAHRDNPERVRVLLANPVHTPGEPAEQIAAYQELVTNNSIVEAATDLYVDNKTKQYKRGASGKGSGTPRRLADVLSQFDLTWDLYAMSKGAILDMIPAEFDRFR